MTDAPLESSPKSEFARLIRFGIVGGLSFVAYTAAMMLTMRVLGASQVGGAFAGFVLGTAVSYVGNLLFVFGAAATGGNLVRFWIVTTAGLGLNLALAWALERQGSPPLLTAFIVFATVPVFNYVCHRLWTFRDPSARGPVS